MLAFISRCLGDGRDWCRRPRVDFLAPAERTEEHFGEGSDNMKYGLRSILDLILCDFRTVRNKVGRLVNEPSRLG